MSTSVEMTGLQLWTVLMFQSWINSSMNLNIFDKQDFINGVFSSVLNFLAIKDFKLVISSSYFLII